jgi:hypothetical protein
MSRSPHTFLSKNRQIARVAITAIAMLAMAGPALTREDDSEGSKKDEVFEVKAVIQVPGAASFFSFDISWFDPVLKKFFLADRNNLSIDVVDPTDFSITQFKGPTYAGVNSAGNDFSGPDGVLTANNHTELWVGDSPGKVWVIDSKNGAIKTLPVGATNPILVTGTTRADELCYDPKDNLIMIASPGEAPPFVTFISTTTYKVISQLKFPGAASAEQCQWSPDTGKFYINLPAVGGDPGAVPGQVKVIDPKTMTVEQTFTIPLADCAGPQGMAIGPDNQILLGCNAPFPLDPPGHRNSAIIDAKSGKVLKVLKDLGGADEVWFNKDDGHYSIPSCNTPCRTRPVKGATTGPELLGIVDAKQLRLDHTVTTAEQNSNTTVGTGNPRTAHSVAAGGNLIFLPIPAVGGNTPQFDPTLCDSFDDGITRVGTPSTATGCIVILKAKPDNDDRSRVAQERERDDRQN